MDDDRVQDLQKFLVEHLQLTPRRQLFEEHTKTSSVVDSSEQNSPLQDRLCNSEPVIKIDFHVLSELGDFRKDNPHECMSDVNRKKLQRETTKEDDFLHTSCSYQMSNNPIRTKTFREKSRESDQLPYTTKRIQFAPDNSLALSYQKYKC